MKKYIIMAAMMLATGAQAQDRIHYTGTELSNPQRHDGGLSPVVGVHNIQTLRANREKPSQANGDGWTYNHQPMMVYWQGCFYMHYLCDPVDEHVPPSRTMLQTSKDGYQWTDPVILFPEYPVPDGYTKPGRQDKAQGLTAIAHQRVGWYVAKDGTLLAMGNYGVALDKKDDPNDGNGIGRVVREIKVDGSMGEVFFIYVNSSYKPYLKTKAVKATARLDHNIVRGEGTCNEDYKIPFRMYTKAPKNVRKACEEILANPRYRMQWVEEADRNDPLIPLNKAYKAYCDYTLPDGRIACLWKHALTSISSDGGLTWEQPVERAKGFVNSNAKIWGQRLSDGTYATVYNPSEFRWPMAISLSKDGLEYTTLNLVCGEITRMRYGGNYKSNGPQYIRGIQEGNGTPEDGDMWLTYSMNKEDMWVSRVPVPVQTVAHDHANNDFSKHTTIAELTDWNIYSPVMARVGLDGKWLTMKDSDPFDLARIERKIPASKELTVEFDLKAGQNNHGLLQVEFLDENGTACSRIEMTDQGQMRCKGGARYGGLGNYEPGKEYHVKAVLSVKNRLIQVFVNGKKAGQRIFFAPVAAIERVMFRTGGERTFPTIDTEADWYGTLEDAGRSDKEATYSIANFKTSSQDVTGTAAFLNAADYKHHVDYFNTMEDENIVQAIPNAKAWEWMQENIPLFDCPQTQFEQMYYYRWWTIRKHIEKTSVGYAMTEFLVRRSYSDKYNLIASGVGHHIHESRWMRNPIYLDQAMNTWFHGNDGKPMKKIGNYSSWIAHSLWQRYLADGRKDWIVGMLDDLNWEFIQWDTTHRLPNRLFWQADVQDAMEETISGGRRKKYMRPSINSYMYGNAMALANISALAGKDDMAKLYTQRADTIKNLILSTLWNEKHQFFETHRGDSSANVREAIGFMPWYVNMPMDDSKYGVAWLQAADKKGFSAPYGQTTAERRHPEFRTRGVGKCEWDGAVWPFATSQTLTAMANYINRNDNPIVGDSLYFAEMQKYVECQSHRGRPYIGEYLDEVTGYWLKGDQERSRYYNHSTFCDMIITGICGLRPRPDNTIEVNPLLPEGKWDYFCLDNVLYHGRNISIVWDKDGNRYHAGKGLRVFVDGKLVGSRETLGKLICEKVL